MNLEDQLHRLPKVNPSTQFRRQAKGRLMHQIQVSKNETWLMSILSTFKPVQPSQKWKDVSRMRLMNRIASTQQVLGLLAWVKRVVASALVMTIAVTTVLFSVGSKQPVKAADNVYLQLTSGKAEVKHADHLEWVSVTENIDLAAGDLVRLGDTSSAVIHFFDDSQLRLTENSLLLISRIESSPGFTQQAIIETSLHAGKAWVQTLNIDDDFARFSLATRDAIINTTNGSFDVATDPFGTTEIRVFKRYADIEALSSETRQIIATGRLNTAETLSLDGDANLQEVSSLSALASIEKLSPEARKEIWVLNNLEQDQTHLASLKEREWIRLQAATGVVPGDFLYPVKRAKERLTWALSFSPSDAANAQIEMANQRLAESIVLIQQGKTDSAKQALVEYQEMVRQITDSKKVNSVVRHQLSNKVVVSHQKSLLATLPSDVQIGLVKQALDETEELLAESPIELAQVRLKNTLENLTHIQEYVASGDLQAAQETLVSHDLTLFDVLKTADTLDEESKKAFYAQVLETQYAQERLLNEIQQSDQSDDFNETFAKLIENTQQKLDAGIQSTVAVVQPVLPDIALASTTPLPAKDKVQIFVDKVNIYSTLRGQSNQLTRLLKQNPAQARDLEFLISVRERLDSQTRDLANFYIEQLRADLAAQKSKKVKGKIDRAKRRAEQ